MFFFFIYVNNKVNNYKVLSSFLRHMWRLRGTQQQHQGVGGTIQTFETTDGIVQPRHGVERQNQQTLPLPRLWILPPTTTTWRRPITMAHCIHNTYQKGWSSAARLEKARPRTESETASNTLVSRPKYSSCSSFFSKVSCCNFLFHPCLTVMPGVAKPKKDKTDEDYQKRLSQNIGSNRNETIIVRTNERTFLTKDKNHRRRRRRTNERKSTLLSSFCIQLNNDGNPSCRRTFPQ